MIEPALRWPELGARRDGLGVPRLRNLPVARPDRADVPELSRARGARPHRRGHRPTWFASSRPARSIHGSGAPTNSRPTPICAFTASCAAPSAPAAVDVSSLMLEAKAAYVEKHGLPPGDWISSRIELWARLGSRFPIADQLSAGPSLGALDARAVAGRLAASAAAARAPHFVHAPGGPARLEQAAPAAAGPAGRLFRRRLRQLLRPGAGRGGRLGPPSRRASTSSCPTGSAARAWRR